MEQKLGFGLVLGRLAVMNTAQPNELLKSVQVMVRLHIFPIFSFLAKMLSFLCRRDNIFARNENIGP